MRITQMPVLLIVAGCLGTSAAVLANMLFFIMIGKVNQRSPPNQRISYLWWGSGVRSRFKQLYPESPLGWLLNSCYVIMIVSFIIVVRLWVFG